MRTQYDLAEVRTFAELALSGAVIFDLGVLGAWHKERRLLKQCVHLFETTAGGLRVEGPDEKSAVKNVRATCGANNPQAYLVCPQMAKTRSI